MEFKKSEKQLVDYLTNFVKGLHPEGNLEFRLDGYDHVVVIVNKSKVYRVARYKFVEKNDEVESSFCSEFKKVSPLPISFPKLISKFPFIIYESDYIEGERLTSEIFERLKSEDQEKIISKLGEFLTVIHNFPVSKALEFGMEQTDVLTAWKTNFEKLKKVIWSEIGREEKGWIENKFSEFFDKCTNYHIPVCVTHCDFESEHIYIGPDNKISGIIDFSDIEISDPAYDFQFIEPYPDQHKQELFSSYKRERDSLFEFRRQFYIKTRLARSLRHALLLNDALKINKLKSQLKKRVDENL